jgi:hypothetical protein
MKYSWHYSQFPNFKLKKTIKGAKGQVSRCQAVISVPGSRKRNTVACKRQCKKQILWGEFCSFHQGLRNEKKELA